MIELSYTLTFDCCGKTYDFSCDYDLLGLSTGASNGINDFKDALKFRLMRGGRRYEKRLSVSEADSTILRIKNENSDIDSIEYYSMVIDAQLTTIAGTYGDKVASELESIYYNEVEGYPTLFEYIRGYIRTGIEGLDHWTIYDLNRIALEAAQIEYSALVEARKRVLLWEREEERQKHLEEIKPQQKGVANE